MSVCANCSKASDRLPDSFTRLERIHLLSCAVAMIRAIEAGNSPNQSQDRMVNSSVVTKILLSFAPHERDTFIRHLRQSVGVEITLSRCPHGAQVLE